MSARRLFIAVPLPDDVKTGLIHIQDELVSIYGRGGRTHSDSLHLTLKFLGSVTEDIVPGLVASLSSALRSVHSFGLAPGELGSFGPADAPRVVFMTVEPEAPLQRLARIVEQACEVAGFEREKRPFRGHITIFRPRCRGTITRMRMEQGTGFTVNKVVLFESTLRPDRAYHSVVDTFELAETSVT